MSPVVVEVGPATVSGPGKADPERVSTALACVDDPLALVDDRPVEVCALWRDVLDAAAGGHADILVLVVPTWWPVGRVDVVRTAAEASAPEVVVRQRGDVLTATAGGVVVELSADYVVVLGPGEVYSLVARGDRALARRLQSAASVLIDTPAGVAPLSPAVAAELRKLTVPIAYSDRDRLHDAALGTLASPARRARMSRRAGAVLAGAALTVAAAGGGWAAQAGSDRTTVDASRLLVEGRVAVSVPASWAVERVTTGPGSARVRVSAAGGLPALHVTQADGEPATLAEVAGSLWRAIGSEEPGVFTDFDPAGERAGRVAATYVERRTDSQTRWSVLIDGTLRIAIGCQSAPDRESTARAVCDEAVRSARAVR